MSPPLYDKKGASGSASTHQLPFALNLVQASEQELVKTENVLDDAKEGFHGGFALGVVRN